MATRNTNIVVPNLVKPNVSGSINQWGYILNEDLDKITEFSKKVIADSEMQNQELARLENEKLNIEDIPSKVEPVVQEFLETTIKPQIDDYIDETSKPSLDDYVVVKKGELDQYVTNTSKPSLDTYTGEKKNELNTHTTAKKGELDTYTGTKKTQLDSYTTEKEEELDAHVVVKKGDLDSYTTTKKQEINTFTEEQKGELDTYEKSKESELNVYTGDKKRELDTYEGEKETELNQHTQTKITELSNHTNTKKGELDTYTTQKKGEITTHTDSEIERINADSELANKANKTIQVIAGNGLQGGGALSKDVTLNVVSVNDAIIVNDNDIQLNPVNDLTTGGTDKALSGEMGKKLNTDKQNKTDSRLQTESKEIVGAINESLWHTKPKSVGNTSTQSDLNDLTDLGFYRSQSANNLWLNLPNNLTKASFFLEVIGGNVEYGIIHQIISFTVKNTRYIRWGTKNTSGMGKPNEWGEWQEILTSDSRLFLGNSGISKVVYIQDEGTKTQGQGYVDKTTGQLYLCKATNSDTSVTDKFLLATNIENRDRISVIEEKLGIYHPVGKISTISVSRDENSSSPNLSFSSL